MEMQNNSKRKIIFKSEKNQAQRTVSREIAARFASRLEKDGDILSYQSTFPLTNVSSQISFVGIRRAYRDAEW